MNKDLSTNLHEKNGSIRVRFAPSPTGHLHLGTLRVAIFNWLFARANNGVFLIRIEDTDLERSRPEYTESILDSFAWVGIEGDEPIVIQSERKAEHINVVNRLIDSGLAYRCYCSANALQERLGDSAKTGSYTKYDQYCLLNGDRSVNNSESYAVRFKISRDRESVTFNDLIRGPVTFHRDQLDDFIIVRSDGTPMYNFVVVVDDAFMGITHVLRGEDHISNTPKQILLYEACGYMLPEFGHLPMILGPDGNKLSKRDAATSVLDYKNNGFLPDALCNYLVRLGWSHGDQEIFTKEELIKYFALDAVGKSGAIFDMKKLEWMNGMYIRQMTSDRLLLAIESDINPDIRKKLSGWPQDAIIKCIDLYKDRVKTLIELVQSLELIYSGPAKIEDSELIPYRTAESYKNMNDLLSVLKNLEDFTSTNIASSIKATAKNLQLDLALLAKPLRVALTGHSSSPSVFDIVALVGKDESCKRLSAFMKLLEII